jgi:ABC-type antimicrobial peptide transport system permease subunit
MKHDYRENLGLAFDTLRTHKLRSFLTVVGVMIGVGVIILVVGLLDGFKDTINQEILAWGADTAYVDRFDSDVNHDHPSKDERARKPLTLEDGEALLARCPAIERIAISVFEYEDIHNVRRDKNQVQGVEMRGTFPAFVQVYGNAAMKYGRFFTETENDHREDVAVVGEDVAKALFPTPAAAIGQDVNLDGSTMRIIGVFEKPKGGFGMGDTDRRVVLPYYTFRKIYPAAYEHGYRIQGYPGQLDRAVDEAREALRRLRNVPYNKPDSFSITTQKEQVEEFNQIIGGVVLAMIVISSIGLLIGGVGVMNIMLVSVTERTREIGVRKAIGARRSDITWQFLFEAMTLTGTGGIIGIVLAVSIVLLIPMISSLQTTVSPGAILAGEVVSIGIGLIFGVWPAVKAARLDPVEALRYE